MKQDKSGNVYYELRMSKVDAFGKPYSIRSLSKDIGINHSRISELERGLKKPSLSELRAYQNFFHVQYSILLDGFTHEEENARDFVRKLIPYTSPEKEDLEKTLDTLFSSALGFVFLQLLSDYLQTDSEKGREKLIACIEMMRVQANFSKTTWQISQIIDNTVR